jgi:hypothetical protein
MPRPRKAKLVELPNPTSFPPHCCIVTGRIDEPVVDFGDPTPKAQGPNDPRVYIRASRVEEAAEDLLGMVPRKEVEELEERLGAAEAETARLTELVGAAEALEQSLERVKAALEPAPDPGDPDQPTADGDAGQPQEA